MSCLTAPLQLCCLLPPALPPNTLSAGVTLSCSTHVHDPTIPSRALSQAENRLFLSLKPIKFESASRRVERATMEVMEVMK